MQGSRLHIEVLDQDSGETHDVEIDIGENEVSIGRDRGSRIVLGSPTVSRNHCRLDLKGEQWEATDGSSIGTLLNGERIEKGVPHPVRHGDVLVCANFQLRLLFVPTTDPTLRPDPNALKRLMEEVDGSTPPRVWVFPGVVDGGGANAASAFDLSSEGSVITFGRSSDCDARLADPLRVTSSIHGKIERNWAGVFLYDTSTNGIFVNGQKVQEQVQLKDGDRVTVAVADEDPERSLLVFAETGNDVVPAPPGAGGAGAGAPGAGAAGMGAAPGADSPAGAVPDHGAPAAGGGSAFGGPGAGLDAGHGAFPPGEPAAGAPSGGGAFSGPGVGLSAEGGIGSAGAGQDRGAIGPEMTSAAPSFDNADSGPPAGSIGDAGHPAAVPGANDPGADDPPSTPSYGYGYGGASSPSTPAAAPPESGKKQINWILIAVLAVSALALTTVLVWGLLLLRQ